jgi:ribose 5-phosphate isomerase B
MKIAVSADHRGAGVIPSIILMLQHMGCQVSEMGVCSAKTCDYPDMAYPVAKAVAAGEADRGILVCGSGIGMCIAANKVAGVRAALVHDEIGAEMSRRHNDANVLCLAADLMGIRIIERVVQLWIKTDFEGGRHARRVAKITAIEQGRDPVEVEDPAATLAAE